MRFARLGQRLYNAPLAIHPRKLEIVMAALAGRLGVVSLEGLAPAGRPEAFFDDDDDWDFAEPRASRSDPGYTLVDGAAVIPITGTLVQKLGSLRPYSGMTGYDGIREAFGNALTDPAAQGIVLQIDSPGGEVAGMYDLADDIYRARGTKPVAAILDEYAFSAAYLAASSADPGRVYVPRTGGTGSIGIIYVHVDISEALAKGGVKPTAITFGARKADGHSEFPLSPEAAAAIQRDVDELGELFVQTVARNRGLDPNAVRATEAATYQGAAGLAVGLADKVMSPAAALQDFLAAA